MSESRHQPDQLPPDFGQVESMVRAAQGYVKPTIDLRPNLLEAAHDARRQRRTSRRLGTLAGLVLLFATSGFPDLLFSSRLGPAFVQSSDLHRRAARSAVEGGVGPNWALYEVFCELRREQADRLHPSD